MGKRKKQHKAQAPKGGKPARSGGRADGSSSGAPSQRLAWAPIALLVLVPLAVLPALRDPFRLPKLALAEVLMSVCLLTAAIAFARRGAWSRGRRFVSSPALVALAPFWLVAVLSAAAGRHWAHSWQALVALTLAIAVLCVWSLSSHDLRRVLGWTVPPAVLLAALAVLQYSGWFEPFAVLDDSGNGAVTSLAGNVGDLAGYLLLPLLVALSNGERALSEGRKGHAFWWLLGVALLLLVVIQVRVRTVLVALGVVLPVYGWHWLSSRWGVLRRGGALRRWLPLTAIVLLSGGLLLASLARDGKPLNRARLNNLLSGRLDGWQVAAHLFRQHPLLGVGIGGYAAEFNRTKLELLGQGAQFYRPHRGLSTFANAHNDLLEVAAEQGVLGLLALAWCVGVVLRQLHGDYWSPVDRRLALSVLLAWALLSMGWFPNRLVLLALPFVLFLAWLLRPREVSAAIPLQTTVSPWLRFGAVAAALLLVVVVSVRGEAMLRADLTLNRAERGTESMLASGRIDRLVLRQRIEQLQRATREAPYDSRLPLVVGSHYLLLGDAAQAESWYRRALDIEPRPEIYLNLGRALTAEHKQEEGAEALQAAVDLEPSLLKSLSPPLRVLVRAHR